MPSQSEQTLLIKTSNASLRAFWKSEWPENCSCTSARYLLCNASSFRTNVGSELRQTACTLDRQESACACIPQKNTNITFLIDTWNLLFLSPLLLVHSQPLIPFLGYVPLQFWPWGAVRNPGVEIVGTFAPDLLLFHFGVARDIHCLLCSTMSPRELPTTLQYFTHTRRDLREILFNQILAWRTPETAHTAAHQFGTHREASP